MSDELLNQPEPVPSDDVNTTPPNPGQNSAKSGWSMPEPVFRKTSGYLPQGFENKFSQDEIGTDVDDEISTPPVPGPDAQNDVEPQPEIAEVIEETTPVAAAKPEKKGGAMKVVFSIFGILIALGLVLVFIAVVYYLFLMPSSSSTF